MDSLVIVSSVLACTLGTVLIGLLQHARLQRVARVTVVRHFPRSRAPRPVGVVDQARSSMFDQSGTSFRHAHCQYRFGIAMIASNSCSAICAPRAYNRNARSTKACHE
jgi:hypothetical protein